MRQRGHTHVEVEPRSSGIPVPGPHSEENDLLISCNRPPQAIQHPLLRTTSNRIPPGLHIVHPKVRPSTRDRTFLRPPESRLPGNESRRQTRRFLL